ncbi:MAG TPA: alpha/beta hydrolase domain-containing protein [Vicinamibacterales bacterium]|nr:alpha/beta hydrolase domain-containing protein [Vicinamibacterales bacterium]
MKQPLRLAIAFALVFCSPARAEVTRVEVAKRADVGTSGYEKIVGTIHFAVDPNSPRNRVVVDLDKAPVNAAGRVEFSSDLYILRPKVTPGNGAALVDILNRGNKVVLNGFNRGGSPDPETENDLGDRLLMRFGYTIVWVGWEFDVPQRPNAMRVHVPVAADHGKPITGVVRATFTPNSGTTEIAVTDLAFYDAIDPGGTDSQLTARSSYLGKNAETISRDRWRVSGHTVTLDSGFVPGKTYEVRYRAANPPVAGLGFVAVRDTTAWLKHQPDALAPVTYAYGYGSSQSGRFLRSFLYEGFNTDEHERQVFDGVIAHIAGAARLDLNARWSKPTGLAVYSATSFPFADASLRDPVSGAREGALDNPRTAGHAPKIFYTNTAVEYWGTGRAAALIHTSPDGTKDLTVPDNARVYFIAGTQHSPSRFPPSVNNGQQPDNPVDYWWTMRALLLAMHKWVKQGIPPPVSQYPRLDDGTLVAAASVSWPAIPGVASPRSLTAGRRAANLLLADGAGAGAPLPLLVPQVDEVGNERAGIRLPDVAVPLATYTGWNFRKTEIGAPDELVSLAGASIPFPPTRAARDAAHDPRQSIEERYPSHDEYLKRAEQVADALVKAGYLLVDDEPRILQRVSDTWDLVVPQ